MIQIPALLLYLAALALAILLGSGITAVYSLTRRVRALERQADKMGNMLHAIDPEGAPQYL